MKSSVKIVSLFGIPVRIHWTFGFLFVWILYIGKSEGMDRAGIMWLTFLFLSLFVCVVLHELGHALMARRYKIQTQDITLSPIGGIASLTKMPEKPMHEFLVAIAGPSVNFVIAAVLSIYFFVIPVDSFFAALEMDTLVMNKYVFIPTLIVMNIVLGFFNLIPAFPMDGGRIFRALLSFKFNRLKATNIAVIVGKVCAAGFIVGGYFIEDYILVLIGVFVFFMAGQEYKMVKIEYALGVHSVAEIFKKNFTFFQTSDNVLSAIDAFKRGLGRDFLIFEGSEIVGILFETEIVKAMKDGNDTISPIYNHFSQGYENVSVNDSLRYVYEKVRRTKNSIFPVFNNGEFTGIIELSTINNFIRVQEKMAK